MPLPMTTPVSVPFVCWTICWAAARVSKLTLFHCASRCSVIRRIFIFRPLLRDAEKNHPVSQIRPPKKAGGRYKVKNKIEGAQARLPMLPTSKDARFVAQFFDQFSCDFFGLAGYEFGFLGFLRNVDALDFLSGRVWHIQRAAIYSRDFLFLGGHDAFQRGVARFVDPGLNGERGGQRQFDVLEPAGFEFALELHVIFDDFNGHDDGGMRAAEKFGKQHASLAEALIVALQAGEYQIEILGLDRGG